MTNATAMLPLADYQAVCAIMRDKLGSTDTAITSGELVTFLTNGADNFLAQNIKSGVQIFNVTGTYTGDPISIQNSKTVTPTAAGFTVTPDAGYAALAQVEIAGDTNLIASNIKSGETIFGVEGTYELYLQEKIVWPSASTQIVSPDAGYDGLSQVTVGPCTGTALITSTSVFPVAGYANAQVSDANLVASNIKSGETILGILGTYAGTSASLGAKTFTSNGTFSASDYSLDGFSSVTVNLALGGKTFSSNGTYYASSSGYKGYSRVTVDVDVALPVTTLTVNNTGLNSLTVQYVDVNGDLQQTTVARNSPQSITVATDLPIVFSPQIGSGSDNYYTLTIPTFDDDSKVTILNKNESNSDTVETYAFCISGSVSVNIATQYLGAQVNFITTSAYGDVTAYFILPDSGPATMSLDSGSSGSLRCKRGSQLIMRASNVVDGFRSSNENGAKTIVHIGNTNGGAQTVSVFYISGEGEPPIIYAERVKA